MIAQAWRFILDLPNVSRQRMRRRVKQSIAKATVALFRAVGATSPGTSSGTLSVTDNRTNRTYTIPIEHNSVRAIDFRQIAAAGRGADPVDQGKLHSGWKSPGELSVLLACKHRHEH